MFLKPGQIIRFTYQHAVKDEDTGEKYKEVLVLHPHWQGKVHAIDLKRLSPFQRELLETVMTWDWRKHKEHESPSRNPAVNDILRRMNPRREVKNPKIFYIKFVKPFLGGTDAYRVYFPGMMSGVTVAKDTTISGKKPEVERPLFGKKPEEPGQEQQSASQQRTLSPAQQRLAALKARHMGGPGAAKPAAPAAPPTPAAPPRPPMAAQSALKPLPTGAAKGGVAGSSQSSAAARLAALKSKHGIK